ncbi:DUF3570 domain-containing protein [Hymenobacter terrenus]|uniref:DUF3570 domain-containing protein n=1 Tax=Hymenobacter terrenus TaxID=1629124 RepID=UPI0006195802|nr:DUF3570 domain-containing protein [Hymenobacter terrenus]
MKKRYLTIGLLAASLHSSAQTTPDSAYTKQTISRTAIRLLLSHYSQDGNRSAVTGGQGTEKLVVFAPEVLVTHQPDSVQTLQVNAGIDVITSASTDRIDFVLSSASRVDYRGHLNLGYSRRLQNPNLRAGVQSGFSLESDYFSLPVGISLAHQKPDGSREITVGVQAFFDDLRWGRVNPGYYRPVKLIYPAELRTQNWFDIYRRTSVNLTTALSQVINRKLQFALYPEVAYQQGLLSTPFHRVYFNDAVRSLRVENLPRKRWKIPLGTQLNWFATNQIVLRSYYRFYWDSFGISSHTIQMEAPVRITPFMTISPLARLYKQTAARYFRPYAEHAPDAAYYTSDYDLSAFTSYNVGLTLRYAPHRPISSNYSFEAFDLRYSYYKRSDQLSAHTLSLVIDVLKTKARK